MEKGWFSKPLYSVVYNAGEKERETTILASEIWAKGNMDEEFLTDVKNLPLGTMSSDNLETRVPIDVNKPV